MSSPYLAALRFRWDPDDSVTVRAPAKINLGLSVGGPRSDGFHDVATAYHAISLQDELVAAASEELSVAVTTADGIPLDDVPQDRSNLAVAAALALAERAGVEPLVRLHVTKSIPVAGGMAGGSADAAAALVACDALWQTGLSRSELARARRRARQRRPVLAGGRHRAGHRPRRGADPRAGPRQVPLGGRDRRRRAVHARRLRRVRPAPGRHPGARAAGGRRADGGAAHRRRRRARGRAAQRPAGRRPARCGRRCARRSRPEPRPAPSAASSPAAGRASSSWPAARSTRIDIAVALSATGTCRSVRRAHGPVAGARVVGDG